jgi:transcriptional regulator GlxA family with amidase domain
MPTQRVGLLLYPGCLPAGLLSTADLLAAANLRNPQRPFAWRWLGMQAGPVTCAHGVVLHAEAGLADADCDAVLVAGFWAHRPEHLVEAMTRHGDLIDALGGLGKDVGLWSYCTGVALAAESGRLRGQAATASWWMADWLAQRHAQVDWRWEQSCLAHRRVVTASGTHGHQAIVGEQVQRVSSPEVWHDISQFAVLPRPHAVPPAFLSLQRHEASDAWMHRLRRTVEGLPASEVRLDRLATLLASSVRTLTRRVQVATGGSAGDHVRLIKLHQAGERLLRTGQSVAQVSDGLGFSDETSFRRAFRRVTGLTPAEYRERFRR